MPKGTLQPGLRILNWNEPNVITNVFDMKRVTETQGWRCCIVGFDNGGRDHEPSNAGASGSWKKPSKDSLLPEGMQFCQHLTTPAPVRLISTFWQPQLSGGLCWFKPKTCDVCYSSSRKLRHKGYQTLAVPTACQVVCIYLACARPPRKTRLPLRAKLVKS